MNFRNLTNVFISAMCCSKVLFLDDPGVLLGRFSQRFLRHALQFPGTLVRPTRRWRKANASQRKGAKVCGGSRWRFTCVKAWSTQNAEVSWKIPSRSVITRRRRRPRPESPQKRRAQRSLRNHVFRWWFQSTRILCMFSMCDCSQAYCFVSSFVFLFPWWRIYM